MQDFPWPSHLIKSRPLHADRRSIEGVTGHELAMQLGVTRRTIERMKILGCSYWQADRLATCVLGMHPVMVWPDWYEYTNQLITRELVKQQKLGELFSVMRAHVEGTD